MLDTRRVAWTMGIWTALTFIVCVIHGLIVPERLHMSAFLEQVLPAFQWLTPIGFVLGFLESFLFGAYAGMLFCWIYNRLWRRRDVTAPTR